jgi:flagellin-like hook-associated protein FlgL
MSDIALTAAQRSALLTLQNVADLSDRTQTRLSNGRKVNSVVDDAVAFFQGKALSDRAADFNLRKDGIDQGISSVTAALNALEATDSLLKQLKGVVEASKSQTTAERVTSNNSFREIGTQIAQLIEDASYQGLNLISNTGATLDIAFSVRTASRIQITGFDLNNSVQGSANMLFTASGGVVFGSALSFVGLTGINVTVSSFTGIGENNSAISNADNAIAAIDSAISRVRAVSAELGSNVAILQTRLDFTNQYVNTLEGGSDKLTLADLNEEGANLVALQTRQQLGIQSLAIAGQQQQSILALLQ